ncbi:MAG: UDP-3-O-(3-hydroxymyristoyl)glucosamine N-acyltransferase [Bacteroidota bacterium]
MNFSAKQLAQILEGTIEGNEDVSVNKLSKIEEGSEGSISFLANPKYVSFIYETKASIVIVGKDFVPEKPISSTLIKVENPYQSFAKLLEAYNSIKNNKVGIEQPSFISETAKVGENVYIGAFAYIGNKAEIGQNVKIYPHVYVGDGVIIKDNSVLYAGVKVYTECEVGKNCIIHSGTVIGSDGFGYSVENGKYIKVPQTGNVVIEDEVEIGGNACIDRATLGSTIIRKGVKIDNLVHIAHNVEIDENTAVAAQSGIAGSSKIGKNCQLGGQVGIAGHLSIADNVKIQAQSGIASNITTKGLSLQGSPALPIMNFKKSYVHFKNLPDIIAKKENK